MVSITPVDNGRTVQEGKKIRRPWILSEYVSEMFVILDLILKKKAYALEFVVWCTRCRYKSNSLISIRLDSDLYIYVNDIYVPQFLLGRLCNRGGYYWIRPCVLYSSVSASLMRQVNLPATADFLAINTTFFDTYTHSETSTLHVMGERKSSVTHGNLYYRLHGKILQHIIQYVQGFIF